MRLLNVETFEFAIFYTDIPDYVIASHRWLPGPAAEASFHDVASRQNSETAGYRKVENFVAFVRKHVPNVKWLWVDTCCINKQDAQELSEAINSMFKWYDHAAVCIAYLADVERVADLEAFERSEWFSRGWTLQELLAPETVVFLTSSWDVIGHKGGGSSARFGVDLQTGESLEEVIATRTRIPIDVLHDYSTSGSLTQAEKMGWMEGRRTTREEDMVYALFGILDVALGANYGEGKERAMVRLQRETLFDSNTGPFGRQTQAPPSSTIPHSRDPDFVAPDKVMAKISQSMSYLAPRIALVGQGGVGKSQLAVEYSHNYREEDPKAWVIWIDSSSAARFAQSIRDFFALARIPGAQDPKADLSKLLRLWLGDKRNGPWLLILDNADDAEYLVETDTHPMQFPVYDHGAVVVTSRSKTAAECLVPGCEIIDVPSMDKEAAVDLLGRKIGTPTKPSNEGSRKKIVSLLGLIPLAITQAGVFLKRRGLNASTQQLSSISVGYIETLKSMTGSLSDLFNSEVDNKDLGRERDAVFPLLIAWRLSFEQIFQERKSAADLLSFMAVCDVETVSDVLMEENSVDFARDKDFLAGFSFIFPAGDHSSVMPRSVRTAVRRWLVAQEKLIFYTDWLFQELEKRLPWPEESNAELCALLFPQVLHLMPLEGRALSTAGPWATLMAKGARIAHERRYDRGHDVVSTKSYDELISQIGEIGTPERIQWKPDKQLRREQAVQLGYLCWKTTRNSLGEDHPKTLDALEWLAVYCDSFGAYEKAAELQTQYMGFIKEVEGADQPTALRAMERLATYDAHSGDPGKAAVRQEEVLTMTRQHFGEKHPNTLEAMSVLAKYYSEHGDDSKAAELQEKCLEIKIRDLGHESDHPLTLASMSTLASSYSRAGAHKRAIGLGYACWQHKIHQLGDNLPDTLKATQNLTAYLDAAFKAGFRYVDYAIPQWSSHKHLNNAAELILRSDLTDGKQQSDYSYRENKNGLAALATSFRKIGDHRGAVKVEERRLEALRTQHGDEHEFARRSLRAAITDYQALHNVKSTVALLEQNLKVNKRLLGLHSGHWLEHDGNDVILEGEVLARYYDLLGKLAQGAELQSWCLQAARKVHYSDIEKWRSDRCKRMGLHYREMVQHYDQLGDLQNAMALQRRCYDMYRQEFGDRSGETDEPFGEFLRYCDELDDLEAAREVVVNRWNSLAANLDHLSHKNPKSLPPRIILSRYRNTLIAMIDLALWYFQHGEIETAVERGERCWESSKKKLGERQSDELLEALGNLAAEYSKVRSYVKAVEIAEACWKARKQLLGADDKATKRSEAQLNGYLEQMHANGGRRGPAEWWRKLASR